VVVYPPDKVSGMMTTSSKHGIWCDSSDAPSGCLPCEPSLARALVAHERAVRRGPDPVE
jgi:hypothetical protein